MSNQENENGIIIDLGFIGHKADKLQKLFKGYSTDPNENGKFLKFENYTEVVVNEGVTVHTNCFDCDKNHFLELLHGKVLSEF